MASEEGEQTMSTMLSLELPQNKLRRNTSNRFHVSKSGDVSIPEDSCPHLILPQPESSKAGSEPPRASSATTIQRKTSAASRFLVNEVPGATSARPSEEARPNAESCNEWYLSRPGSRSTSTAEVAQTPDSTQPGKAVHFSVGNEGNSKDVEGQNNATMNLKSWRNLRTLDHPPIMDFYRNSVDQGGALNSRPSMNQLIHGEKSRDGTAMGIDEFKTQTEEIFDGQLEASVKLEKFKPPAAVPRAKFGWIQGVFVRCLLNIFGVMLYLRVSWVAGQAGIGLGMLVVLLASLVTSITAISTCAICTNGDVKGGGAYFLISRSLGPEFGGSIGLIFSVANAVGAALYVVGFAETVRDIMKENEVSIIDGGLNDVRIIGLVTCTILMAIVFVGTSFESKMQLGLLVILTLSIINYMIGTVLPISEEQSLKGITGYSFTTMIENMLPDFRDGYNFFSVFAVYFPAATGIMAGANISGDLADPQRAIPKGTLLAIAVTTVIYMMIVFMTGSTCVRYADGSVAPVIENSSHIIPDCAQNFTCEYGLMRNYQIMETESFWGPLIIAGIFAATLSSALASLVSAPKIFQAVAKDRLFPKIGTFAKGYGKDEEPRRAYALGFVIAMSMILIGQLDAIAPIISNFFLASYALINYACFDASFADSPGFRPGFKYYNMWISLAGALLCVSVMFIISWSTALLTFFFFAMIFLYILHRKPDVNWGSSTQAHSYKSALQAMLKLANTEEHIKNYRPQLLVLTGNPAARPSLVDFVYNIAKGSSLMICGYVVPYAPCDRVSAVIRKLDRQLNEWLKKRHVKSFYVSVANPSLRAGAQTLMQVSGLGKLRPNIVIIGFKANWTSLGPDGLDEINDYFGIIQDAFENNLAVGVLRNVGGGLDYSELMKRHNVGDTARLNLPDVNQPIEAKDSYDFTNRRNESDMKLTAPSDRSSRNGSARKEVDIESGKSNLSSSSLREPNRSESLKIQRQNAMETDDYRVKATANTLDASDVKNFDAKNEDYLNSNLLIRLAATGSYLANCPLENFDDDDECRDDADGDEEDAADYEDETFEDEPSEETRLTVREGEKGRQHDVTMRKDPAVKIVADETTKSPSNARRQSLYEHMSLIRRRGSRRPTAAQRELVASISRFQRKLKGARIDVWWLYDDGGLTLLIPHLLTIPKSYLENARLRVYSLTTSSRSVENEQRSMAALLSKFRIDFTDVSLIPDIGKKPCAEMQEEFEKIIAPFRTAEEGPFGLITDSELRATKDKTNRQLRTAELLRQHSSDADLVVLTLPVPRKGLVSSCLYLSWLDIMTRNLPPTFMIRGNQTSVLTFYS